MRSRIQGKWNGLRFGGFEIGWVIADLVADEKAPSPLRSASALHKSAGSLVLQIQYEVVSLFSHSLAPCEFFIAWVSMSAFWAHLNIWTL
jgi:hypothetical protein